MKKSKKMLTVKVERTIPASPKEVFNGWLNAKVPGTPWYEGDRLIFNPKVDGLFYWYISGTPITADLKRSNDRLAFSILGCHPTRVG